MQTGAAGIKLPTFSRLFDDLLSAVTICVIKLCNVCLSGFKLPSFKLIFFLILIFVLRDSLVQSAAKKVEHLLQVLASIQEMYLLDRKATTAVHDGFLLLHI